MTRPEAVDPADIFREHLRVIRDLWDDMLPTIKAAPISSAPRGTRTSTSDGQDNSDANTDVDQLTVTLSTRHDILTRLNGWARVIVEDWNVTHRLPERDGLDVPALTHFLDRWALAFSGHEAFEDALEEVAMSAREVEQIARPQPRDWMILGPCPVEVEHADGTLGPCGGQVRAWPQTGSDRDPRCRSCGTEAVVEWWMNHIVGNPGAKDLVTTSELIGIIAWRLHWTVTHERIRQWAARGKIERAGRDSKGRTLYDHREVVERIGDDVRVQRERMGA